jgi:hypothetical protein
LGEMCMCQSELIWHVIALSKPLPAERVWFCVRTWLHMCGVRGGQALHPLPLIDGASGSLLLAFWRLVSRGPCRHMLCLALPWSFVKVPYIISELPR